MRLRSLRFRRVTVRAFSFSLKLRGCGNQIQIGGQLRLHSDQALLPLTWQCEKTHAPCAKLVLSASLDISGDRMATICNHAVKSDFLATPSATEQHPHRQQMAFGVTQRMSDLLVVFVLSDLDLTTRRDSRGHRQVTARKVRGQAQQVLRGACGLEYVLLRSKRKSGSGCLVQQYTLACCCLFLQVETVNSRGIRWLLWCSVRLLFRSMMSQ